MNILQRPRLPLLKEKGADESHHEEDRAVSHYLRILRAVTKQVLSRQAEELDPNLEACRVNMDYPG